MKYIKFIAWIFVGCICLLKNTQPAHAQNNVDVFEVIKADFKSNNTHDMLRFMNESVDIQTPDQDRKAFSKTQAEFVLRDFIKKYPVSDFKYIHKLDKADMKFAIGEYTSGGNSFRVTMYLKNIKGQYLIDSIVIEPK
jgi:hypothetical protein